MASTSSHDSQLSILLENLLTSATDPAPELPVVDWRSDTPLTRFAVREEADAQERVTLRGESGQLWLDGNVLMCGCPDCGAPMSVRLWLMLADCWQCGTSIELSEELVREAERLLMHLQQKQQRGRKRPQEPPRTRGESRSLHLVPGPPGKQRSPRPPAEPPPPPSPPPPAPARPAAAQRPRRAAAAAPSRVRARLQQPAQAAVLAWVDNLFHDTPAWLVSLLFHLILLTLLGLLTIRQAEDDYITLSTTVNKHVLPGGEVLLLDPQDEIAFDLLPKNIDVRDPEQRAAILRAEQEARKLRLDPDAVEPNLPELAQVKQAISSTSGPQSALAARDPRLRVEMLKREGGTTLTEAAVARGLRWLAQHQASDGRWSLDDFDSSPGCTCTATGVRSDSAGTSLALLPFLGAGQTHLVGQYQDTVSRALRWLLERQQANGDLRAGSGGNTGMYAHGQGAIVLCEAFFMTGDERLRLPAQRSIDFIVEAQHVGGGWRYSPGMEGDTSVLGWQLMALQSARAAKLTVPEETLELAGQYLDSVSYRGGALYSYMPRKPADEVMTAEALLCRAYLGWTMSTPGFDEGVNYLSGRFAPDAERSNLYYWYYATQLLHHVGGPRWDQWNQRIREILVETQERRGHEAGSWKPIHSHDRAGGRLYATSLATCTLEVYYRHLPIFRQIELE